MIRLYALGLLLPLSIPALAQQPDTIRLAKVGIQDSVQRRIIYCPAEIRTEHHYLPPLLPIQEQLRQVAGVQATPYSGAPGAGEVVRIRGAASLDGYTQPLYVVDGVPVFQYRFASLTSEAAASFQNAGFNPEAGSNPLLSIPVEDIAQVEVLKGAYATGQYGFLGLNGIVRITTKRGAALQPLRVRYTGYGGVQQARHRYSLLGARELAEVANEADRNNGYDPYYSPSQLAAFGAGTDWQDELLRTAAVQEHHLSAAGGTQFGTRYYAAADYLHQTGIVLRSGLQRYGLRLNLDQQVGQRVQLSGGVNYGETQVQRPEQTTLPLALRYLPMLPVYRPEGTYATDYGSPNPVQRAIQNYSTPRNRRLLAQAQAQVKLVTGLHLELQAALERDSLRAADYQGPGLQDSSRIAGLQTGLRRAAYQQLTLHPALRYEQVFREQHAVEASAEAFLWQWRLSQQFTQIGRSSTFPYEPNGSIGSSEYEQQQSYQAYQLRASYTYAGRYSVAGSWQRNRSAHLPADQNTQGLPAVQATWHVAQETWLKDRTPISQLDARVGWGRTSNRGNVASNRSLLLTLGGNLGSLPLLLDELGTQWDAGLDVGLWQNRLTLNTAVYRRETQVQTAFAGQQQFMQSSILNRGLETTVAAAWQFGKLKGTSSLAAAFNHNRYNKPADSQALAYSPSSNFLTQFGQPVSSFAGNVYLGLDANGSPLFEQGTNGSGPARQPLGSGLPRQLASLHQTLQYGKLSLQLQLDGMFGYQVLDTNLRLLDVPNNGFNASTRVRDRWTPAHTDTQVPRAGTNYSLFSSPSSYTLQSGNHVRLSSTTLTANVWERGPRSVSVFLSGNNLLVFTSYRGFDPNVSAAEADPKQAGLDRGYYPTARTVLLGVRATL